MSGAGGDWGGPPGSYARYDSHTTSSRSTAQDRLDARTVRTSALCILALFCCSVVSRANLSKRPCDVVSLASATHVHARTHAASQRNAGAGPCESESDTYIRVGCSHTRVNHAAMSLPPLLQINITRWVGPGLYAHATRFATSFALSVAVCCCHRTHSRSFLCQDFRFSPLLPSPVRNSLGVLSDACHVLLPSAHHPTPHPHSSHSPTTQRLTRPPSLSVRPSVPVSLSSLCRRMFQPVQIGRRSTDRAATVPSAIVVRVH
jgi:hypothetical protein